MNMSITNDEKKLRASAVSIGNIIKQLEECETQLKSITEDLKENWKDSVFEADKNKLVNTQENLKRNKVEIKKTLASIEKIAEYIKEYLDTVK